MTAAEVAVDMFAMGVAVGVRVLEVVVARIFLLVSLSLVVSLS